MKPQTYSRYEGVPLGQPSPRQLPRHWTLEESRPKPSGDSWFLLICAAIGAYAVVRTFLDWI